MRHYFTKGGNFENITVDRIKAAMHKPIIARENIQFRTLYAVVD
ncbi:MAG: hypothetical protein ACXWLH_05440 [Candidatus Saccharimonadales bacterium]